MNLQRLRRAALAAPSRANQAGPWACPTGPLLNTYSVHTSFRQSCFWVWWLTGWCPESRLPGSNWQVKSQVEASVESQSEPVGASRGQSGPVGARRSAFAHSALTSPGLPPAQRQTDGRRSHLGQRVFENLAAHFPSPWVHARGTTETRGPCSPGPLKQVADAHSRLSIPVAF